MLIIYLQASTGSYWWLLLCIALIPMAFWPFYLIGHDMNPLEALSNSYKLVLSNLGAYLPYVLLVLGLSVLVGVTLGIAGIWVVPFFMITPGVMFAHAEGLQGDYSH